MSAQGFVLQHTAQAGDFTRPSATRQPTEPSSTEISIGYPFESAVQDLLKIGGKQLHKPQEVEK